MADSGLTLDGLAEKAKRVRDNIIDTKQSNYKLARELGFTSYEAIALQSSSEDTIRRLANEREIKSGA